MKCQEQIHLSVDRAMIIPANPEKGEGKDRDYEIELKGRKIKRSQIININPDNKVKVIIPKHGLISIFCNHDLTVKEGDGKNQRRDIVLECNKNADGCGFKKTMGNDLWNACHCECCDCEVEEGTICKECSDEGYVKSVMTFSCKEEGCGKDITNEPGRYDGICSDCKGGLK